MQRMVVGNDSFKIFHEKIGVQLMCATFYLNHSVDSSVLFCGQGEHRVALLLRPGAHYLK